MIWNKKSGDPHLVSGNALFLVLIAVALFAGLSYAVTLTSRGGGNVKKEELQLQASSIIQYTASVRAAVQRMILIGQIDENALSFQNTVYQSTTGSLRQPASYFPNCTDTSCQVYHPDGGGITPITIDQNIAPAVSGTTSPGHVLFMETSVLGVGTSANDLVMFYLYLTEDLCMALNDVLGVPNDSGAVPIDIPTTSSPGSNTYTNDLDTLTGVVLGDEYAPLTGQTAFCVDWNRSGHANDFMFYQVLVDR